MWTFNHRSTDPGSVTMGSRKSGTTEDRLTREAFDIEEVNQVRELGWGSDKE